MGQGRYTDFMTDFSPTTADALNSPSRGLQALDSRVKIVLLMAITITVFFIDSPLVLALLALGLGVLLGRARCEFAQVFKWLLPILFIGLFTLLFNSFSGNGQDGGVAFTVEGALRGLTFALRMVDLALASFVITVTTSPEQLMSAFRWFLRPFAALGVPVDDIAVTLSLALRFIPLVAQEYGAIRQAQWCRGASIGEGCLGARLQAATASIAPLFAGLFRRGALMAQAMDARCYGGTSRRSELQPVRATGFDGIVLLLGLALCVALAWC